MAASLASARLPTAVHPYNGQRQQCMARIRSLRVCASTGSSALRLYARCSLNGPVVRAPRPQFYHLVHGGVDACVNARALMRRAQHEDARNYAQVLRAVRKEVSSRLVAVFLYVSRLLPRPCAWDCLCAWAFTRNLITCCVRRTGTYFCVDKSVTAVVIKVRGEQRRTGVLVRKAALCGAQRERCSGAGPG